MSEQVLIPGFEMIEPLGQGGMATVWKARQLSLDRIVAIKVLSAHFAGSPDDISRFQAEAQAAAKLKHPGIVQVYDANVAAGRYFFVMEYVAGYTVGEWVRRKKVLPEKEVLLVAECVADALSYAWERERIIHCDIKPDNVMVDADGTVKVTDLGLARTISAMTQQGAIAEEVLGTPAYISPEQARGELDLDFRADVYSLGAMIYHLTTGHMLFQGQADDEVMEQQVVGIMPDPIEMNPHCTKALCWLLEKMLAKNREHRFESWAAVKAEISRVKNGMMPRHLLASGVPSTVRRSPARIQQHAPTAPHTVSTRHTANSGAWLGWGGGALLLVLLIVAAFAVLKPRRQPSSVTVYVPDTVAPLPAQSAPGSPGTTSPPDDESRRRYQALRDWITAHPEQYDDALRQINELQRRIGPGEVEDWLRRDGRELRAQRDEAVNRLMVTLLAELQPLAEQGALEDAAGRIERYAGRLALETRRARLDQALNWRRQAETQRAQAREQHATSATRLGAELDAAVNLLFEQGVSSARDRLATLTAESLLQPEHLDVVHAVIRQLTDASEMDRRILESFLSQRGEYITVQLANGGNRAFTVTGIEGDQIVGNLKVAMQNAVVAVRIPLRELAPAEKLRRMGPEDQPEAALVRGLMAYKARAYSHARRYFELTHEALKVRLLQKVQSAESSGGAANERGAGLSTAPQMVAESQPELSIPSADPAPETVRPPAPGLPSLAITEAMIARNPELVPGDVVFQNNEAGQVVAVSIVSPGISDLTPLALFPTLRRVHLSGVPPGHVWRTQPLARFRDLAPLRNLTQLEQLAINNSLVRDLSPLKGLPISDLNLRDTGVTELDALRGMPLDRLCIRRLPIKDISVLRGMKIAHFDAAGTGIFDYNPLAAMPLVNLDVSQTPFRDFTVLKNASLRQLNAAGTRIINFAALRGYPLEELTLNETQFRDAALLRELPIKRLSLGRTGVTDISPLAGLPLVQLDLSETTIRDFTPLRQMALRDLNLKGTRFADVTLVSHMPIERLNLAGTDVVELGGLTTVQTLRHLDISETKVKDLGFLATMSLVFLDCRGTRIRDFAPLRQSSVEDLCIDLNEENGLTRRALRGMPALKHVNGAIWSRW